MGSKVAFVLCLLSMSCCCLASQANFFHPDAGFDTQNDSYNDFSLNILDLFLKESYPDFLTRLSYTNLSEVCQNQMRSFAIKLDRPFKCGRKFKHSVTHAENNALINSISINK